MKAQHNGNWGCGDEGTEVWLKLFKDTVVKLVTVLLNVIFISHFRLMQTCS